MVITGRQRNVGQNHYLRFTATTLGHVWYTRSMGLATTIKKITRIKRVGVDLKDLENLAGYFARQAERYHPTTKLENNSNAYRTGFSDAMAYAEFSLMKIISAHRKVVK